MKKLLGRLRDYLGILLVEGGVRVMTDAGKMELYRKMISGR